MTTPSIHPITTLIDAEVSWDDYVARRTGYDAEIGITWTLASHNHDRFAFQSCEVCEADLNGRTYIPFFFRAWRARCASHFTFPCFCGSGENHDTCGMSHHQCESCNFNLSNGNSMCDSCYVNRTYCTICSYSAHRDAFHQDDYETRLCESCYESVGTCDNCSSFLPMGGNYCDDCDTDYCANCSNEHMHNYDEQIHNYSYKPEPLFHPPMSDAEYENQPVYMGVELEVDGGGSTSGAQELNEISKNESLFYLKDDGSLLDGIEIVTHPMTLEYHTNEMPWAEVQKIARTSGHKSHDTGTCGLHVHVNRAGLGRTVNEQQEVISKMVVLFWKMWPDIVEFSRRNPADLHWSKGNHLKSSINHNLKFTQESEIQKAVYPDDRYSAINTQPTHTIEFRLFRGTLRRDTLIAALQFVQLIVECAKKMTIGRISRISWATFTKLGAHYPEFRTYVKDRQARRVTKDDGEVTQDEFLSMPRN